MVFSTIVIINENVYSDSLYEKYTTRREALEWRLEQDYTDNDNNLGATELYKEIQEYKIDDLVMRKKKPQGCQGCSKGCNNKNQGCNKGHGKRKN